MLDTCTWRSIQPPFTAIIEARCKKVFIFFLEIVGLFTSQVLRLYVTFKLPGTLYIYHTPTFVLAYNSVSSPLLISKIELRTFHPFVFPARDIFVFAAHLVCRLRRRPQFLSEQNVLWAKRPDPVRFHCVEQFNKTRKTRYLSLKILTTATENTNNVGLLTLSFTAAIT